MLKDKQNCESGTLVYHVCICDFVTGHGVSNFWKWIFSTASEKLLGSKIWLVSSKVTVKLKSKSEVQYRTFAAVKILTILIEISFYVAAAASEPEANERGSSLISRRLHYRGLQSLFLTKSKELWLCASLRFSMCSGLPQGIVVMREWEDLGCAAYQSYV